VRSATRSQRLWTTSKPSPPPAPEIHTLATTVDTWQRPIIAAIDTGLSNARSEGYNRIVKHIGRIAFEFRNPANRRRRIRWACTRRTRPVTSRITRLRFCKF